MQNMKMSGRFDDLKDIPVQLLPESQYKYIYIYTLNKLKYLTYLKNV